MALPRIQLVGNLTSDPQLAFTASGIARANLRVACNDRKKDQATGQWTDGDTVYLDVTCWRTLAENVAESLTKGDTVLVTGTLRSRTYDGKDGTQREAWQVDAYTVAPDLARATAKVHRATRTSQQPVQDDHWSTTPEQAPW